MVQIIWARPAVAQLDAIGEFIEIHDPVAARRIVQRVYLAVDRLHRFKKLGKRVPALKDEHLRQLWVSPCWVSYRLAGHQIRVLHVRRGETLFDPARLRDE